MLLFMWSCLSTVKLLQSEGRGFEEALCFREYTITATVVCRQSAGNGQYILLTFNRMIFTSVVSVSWRYCLFVCLFVRIHQTCLPVVGDFSNCKHSVNCSVI